MFLKIIDRISEQISAYIRGTFMAATIVGILSIIALQTVCSIFNMPHDYIILVGIIAGVFNLIPFIGPMIGAFSGILLFILSVEPPNLDNLESASFVIRYYHIIFIAAGFGAVQLIDNLVTSPLIISDSVGLHPMFVIIAVLIGGYALGILGMIIAVPFAAILKVIVEELTWGFRNYRYT
jgi:predicted PurR-regulated permease PerM